MNNSTNNSRNIIILPCNGDSAAGLITLLAAQELVLEETAQGFSDQLLCREYKVEDETRQPVIVVSGCLKQCRFIKMSLTRLAGVNRLPLPEVGIDPDEVDEITREDIDLAKDATIAECAPVGNTAPALFLGCCCW